MMARLIMRLSASLRQLYREARYFASRSKLILKTTATNQAMHLVKTLVWCEVLAISVAVFVALIVLVLLTRKAALLSLVLGIALIALELVIYLVYDNAQTSLLAIARLSTKEQLLRMVDRHFQLSQLRKQCGLKPKVL